MSVKLAALLMLNGSLEIRGKTERGTSKVFGKRKRKFSSVYVVDILVMIVFFDNHSVTLVYLY